MLIIFAVIPSHGGLNKISIIFTNLSSLHFFRFRHFNQIASLRAKLSSNPNREERKKMFDSILKVFANVKDIKSEGEVVSPITKAVKLVILLKLIAIFNSGDIPLKKALEVARNFEGMDGIQCFVKLLT